MLVRDAGEFQVIRALAEAIADDNARGIERLTQRGFRLRLTIGDDAAAWDAPAGVRVFTTDTMVERVHFDLRHIGWRDLGWKSLAVNQSDVAAMGCTPTYAIVTLGLRADLPVEGLTEMYRGMMDACREFGGAVVGGDIVRSPAFFITVALEGAAQSEVLLTRDAASPGDVIAVTGHLGCSAAGLRLMAEGLSAEPETATHLRDAHNRPRPRVDQGEALAAQGVRAAMDVSDGLVDDLGKMCEASGVGALIRVDDVPADDYLKRAFPEDWAALALGGGEDYELLFTASPELVGPVTAALDVPVSVIGEIVNGPPRVRVLDTQGNDVPVSRGGWDHFGSP